MATNSIAVWDVPLPVVAGEHFAIKVGIKSAAGATPIGNRVEVCDASGSVAASGALGDTPWPGTEALHWVGLNVVAPATPGLAAFTVRCAGASTRFSVAAVAKPEHRLTVTVTEKGTGAALSGVEIRLGAFHARTDEAGRAELAIGKGDYQLLAWKAGHQAPQMPITIKSDANIAITILHVPEEHPDARWVR
jgi:hypothetical protein